MTTTPVPLRLLGSGSKDGGCPALYAEDDIDALIVQGIAARNGGAVLVPHALLDWAEPGSRLTVETTDTPGTVLVTGMPVTGNVKARLTLDPDETAVEVPRCAL
ncbi:hypothetical protein [Nocardia mexicana]|uniref:Uncharacterized protein n=1 Tax=Nocardia mexicana TaxID=279262 RepID=A0A370GMP3_9NOCA|nr:hypothetical protein [Nocardia mexicana]RDI44998.1 hypothetical protein DFR68_11419 [Nocardia mexicana]